MVSVGFGGRVVRPLQYRNYSIIDFSEQSVKDGAVSATPFVDSDVATWRAEGQDSKVQIQKDGVMKEVQEKLLPGELGVSPRIFWNIPH